jgi:hypothetical protein
MFMFVAISPEVNSVADDNRLFHVNVAPKENDWETIDQELHKYMTDENCRGLRSLAWQKLPEIIEYSQKIAKKIQAHTKKGHRFAISDGYLLATYIIVWNQRYFSEEELDALIQQFYEWQPPEEAREETDEIIDRLLDEAVFLPEMRETHTLREMCQRIRSGSGDVISTGGSESRENLSKVQVINYRKSLGRYGLGVNGEGDLMIANNHHMIMRTTGKDKGYHKQLKRHPAKLSDNHVCSISGKARRCVVISGSVIGEG